MRAWYYVHCSLLLLATLGCESKLGSIDGTVTLDGQPVPDGMVTFIKEGNSAREGAVIKDGKFRTQIPPGSYKLELNGQKDNGSIVRKGFDGKDEIIPQTVERFPEKYNKKSELKKEIKAGTNAMKLELNSMP